MFSCSIAPISCTQLTPRQHNWQAPARRAPAYPPAPRLMARPRSAAASPPLTPGGRAPRHPPLPRTDTSAAAPLCGAGRARGTAAWREGTSQQGLRRLSSHSPGHSSTPASPPSCSSSCAALLHGMLPSPPSCREGRGCWREEGSALACGGVSWGGRWPCAHSSTSSSATSSCSCCSHSLGEAVLGGSAGGDGDGSGGGGRRFSNLVQRPASHAHPPEGHAVRAGCGGSQTRRLGRLLLRPGGSLQDRGALCWPAGAASLQGLKQTKLAVQSLLGRDAGRLRCARSVSAFGCKPMGN